jgi:selT/selW/selH-like putative selenoprotein
MESVLEKGRAASFEVTFKGETIFSKIKEGRFPKKEEVLDPIRSKVNPPTAPPKKE